MHSAPKGALPLPTLPLLKTCTRPARILYAAQELCFLMIRPRTGVTRPMFTCITHSLRVIASNHLVMETTMQRGSSSCRAFFLVTKGVLMGMRGIIGLKKRPCRHGDGPERCPLRHPDSRRGPGGAAPDANLAVYRPGYRPRTRGSLYHPPRTIGYPGGRNFRTPMGRKGTRPEDRGIGLALVKRIVVVYGGGGRVVSEAKGHGASFYFPLPQNRAGVHHD